MATFDPISYTYKPTAPRSKSANARRKPASDQPSILDKLQRSKLSSAALDGSHLPAPAAADNNGGYRSGIQVETGTCYSSSSDDDDLPTIEEILYPALHKKGFTTIDPSPDNTALVEEVAAEERGGFMDHNKSVPSSSGNPDNPIDLLGNDDSSASEAEAEVDDSTIRAEGAKPDASLFDNPEAAVKPITPAPPCSSDGWHDIDDFPETAPRLQLAEQGASTPESIPLCNPSSHLSSELLHDRIDIEGFYTRWTRSDSAHPQSPPPRQPGASPENQLSEEDYLSIGRSVVDEHEHELVPSVLDTDSFDEGEADENNDKDNSHAQQEANDVAAVVASERVGDTHLSSKEDGRPRPAERQQSLPSRDPSPEPSQDRAGGDNHSNDKLNNTDLDDDEEELRPIKRKRPSSSCDSAMRKKQKHRLQQKPTRRHRPYSTLHRRLPKSRSPPGQGSRIVEGSSGEGRSPSPAPSAPYATDTDILPGCYNLDRSSGAVQPTLTEVTFRPHSSPDHYSFIAVVQVDHDRPEFSLDCFARLIENTGHIGEVVVSVIKWLSQGMLQLTGFSQLASPRLSPSVRTKGTPPKTGRIHSGAASVRHWHGKAVDAGATTSLGSELSSSDDDNDSSSSGDDGCSSEADQGRSTTSKQSRWSSLDEQRLLAYKKEGKSWDWIFKKFPGRTRPAVRTRWTMVQRRVK